MRYSNHSVHDIAENIGSDKLQLFPNSSFKIRDAILIMEEASAALALGTQGIYNWLLTTRRCSRTLS